MSQPLYLISANFVETVHDNLRISAYIGRYIFKPKLIIGAGGDEFFMIDDTKFYFRQLLGDKYLR